MTSPTSRQKTVHLPELLAPAGSHEAFRAAVHAGADAIYLSGKRFGARKFAANFSDEEIEEAVRFAHIHGVRVYVTVNTLIHDRELSSVLEYLIWLYATGVDAVLVQDTGIAALARVMVPGLVLHASTQMTIHNSEGVRWAAEQGFSRVVLARELSLDEVQVIADATQDTGTGLEVFVHGALCYGYSGQCQLSSVIGGRSGNRGMCAQPCRKPWNLVAGNADEYGRPKAVREIPVTDRYLLSPKDLCTYRHLGKLVQSSVSSLKIEGRMKSAEYVAIVVSTYRKALDAIAAGNWEPSDAAERDLNLAFNRGFSAGYLFGERHDRLMGRDAPDNRGLRIGTVIRSDKAQSLAIIRPECPVIPEQGDGMLFAHPAGAGETGFALNTATVLSNGELHLRVPRPVPVGSAVFITSSRELDARARQLITKVGPGLRRPIPLDLIAEVSPEGTLVISGSVERPDGTVVPITCRPEMSLVLAESQPLSKEMIARQLEKSGGTPFIVRSLAIDYDGTRFAPLAEINRLRREFFAAATEQLVNSYRPPVGEVRRIQHQWQNEATRFTAHAPDNRAGPGGDLIRIGICVDSIEAVKEAAEAGVDSIYFEPDLVQRPAQCGKNGQIIPPLPLLEEAIGICRDTNITLVWKLPRITHDRYLSALLGDLPSLAAAGLTGCMVENSGAARAVRAACPKIPIRGFTGLNIFNHAAVIAAGSLLSGVTLSPELSRDELALIHANLVSRNVTIECALIVQGTSEAMITKDCVSRLLAPCADLAKDSKNSRDFMGIRDDEGQVFPVVYGGECRTSIGNSRELCLIEYLPLFPALGIREAIIDARHRPPQYVRSMSRIYQKAHAEMFSGQRTVSNPPRMESLKREISRIALGDLTPGHFLRGIKE